MLREYLQTRYLFVVMVEEAMRGDDPTVKLSDTQQAAASLAGLQCNVAEI
jgi:hypothetical protein